MSDLQNNSRDNSTCASAAERKASDTPVKAVAESNGNMPPQCPNLKLENSNDSVKATAKSSGKPRNFSDDVDGGYGWVMVFATFLLVFSTWGLNSAYGVYFAYYLNSNHYEGATTLDYSAIGGISFGVGLCFSPIVNYSMSKIGTRTTILIGNAMQFAAGILASFAVNTWELFLTQGLLQSFGLAFIGLPALTLVSPWFDKKRVLANGLTVTGSGVGGVVFNMGLQKIIEVRDVNWALRAQAIICVVLVCISTALIKIKPSPKKVKFEFIDFDCVNNAGFWMVCFYLVVVMFGYVIVMYCLSDFTVSLGYTQYQGSIVATMFQVGMCIGRPLAGFLADKFGPLTVTAVEYMLGAIFTLAMWVPAKNYGTAIAMALMQGFFCGTIFPTIAAIMARLVGISRLNVAFCMLWIFVGAAGLFSQLIATAMTSGTAESRYHNTAIFSGVCFVAASVTILILRGYIIARDKIVEQHHDLDVVEVRVYVPPSHIPRCCFAWPKKRA
jgi:MFS family permease